MLIKILEVAISDKNPQNRDPISGKPGAHPVGTGVGAAGGAATGAAIGAVGGPVGAVVGRAVGGVAGGLAGKGVAEKINPTVEEAYWREQYVSDPDYVEGYNYDDDYTHAYRLGYEGRQQYTGTYEDHENELWQEWQKVKGKSRLTEFQVKKAMKNAWHRVERIMPGDADGDGR